MDEPTDGLDPNQKQAVRTLIRNMSAEKAIIISTHILEEVDAVCSRAIIIDKGRIVADGTPAELLARAPSKRMDDVFRALTTPDAEINAEGRA
jgi:ABC-2 type transport system ATP-binding protein